MARQKKIILSGKIDNIIFYERDGVACARGMPDRVRQSAATKAYGKQFGKANTIAKNLRAGLFPVLPDAKDRRMMYDFVDVVKGWLREAKPGKSTVATDLPFITGFQFNAESELYVRIKPKLTINYTSPGKIIVNIPALDPIKDIAAPAYTETVHWKIMAVSAAIDRDSLTGSYATEIEMPYNKGVQAARQAELPIVLKAGEITVAAISLTYSAKRKGSLQLVTGKRWLPAGVVGACCGRVR